ncbi:MAG: DNA polymerase III subunit alpha [Desulfobacteraceae bacterium]|nr:DNA polymerase III subunit alpha [Desulfobacteraceae bacterium]
MIPLNTRSHYSFMWGTTSVKHLCQKAKTLGYQKIALTDTDNLCGMWPFINACKNENLTPIIGAEITDPVTAHRAVCLVKNNNGYSHLTQLITQRHMDKNFSLKTALPDLSKGLVVLTRNQDLLPFWHENQVDLAVNLARNPLPQQHKLCMTAKKLSIPMVATPGSFFLNKKDAAIHQMLRAIDKNTCLTRLTQTDIAPDTSFLASPDEYHQKFAIHPLSIKNTITLAEKIEFQTPNFGIVMPPLKKNTTLTAEQLLYKKTMRGAKKRYGASLSSRVLNRIDHELTIIQQMNFCEYFLVVQSIVKRASRICGRGSGAASIVAYCLEITNVCPIKYNLYFERFLNPDRKDPPDIDIDFAWDERDDILNWVLSKFKNHAAMVSSHILFQPRMAVREVAKVFGLPDAEIGKVSKRLPWFWKLNEAEDDFLDRIQQRPEFRFMDFPQPWPDIMRYAQAIIGTPRYLSVHPGGIVITPHPIDTYVPIEKAPKGVPLMQWEKDATEQAGLVKIDLLGNRSLGVIRDSIESIKEVTGTFDDFNTLDPEDDYETQQNVAQGNTMGCFYIESPATRLLQKKSNIGDFEHIVIHSSIIRPAANEFIQEYLKRLHTGLWDPIHPLIENVLDETYGIMVYQEDVSKVAVKMAGFSHAQADGLRKIMSKKDKEQALADYYDRFKNGALKKGVSSKDIQKVWAMITSFSGYSFCKPHSASYARVSFQAAYLKTHYPAQFMAAVISNQGGFYSTFAYVSEARRLNVNILNPDVNHSNIQWKGYHSNLRVGLLSIKDLSAKTMKKILTERKKAKFSSPEDFFARVCPREDEIRALIHSGSLNSIDVKKNRATLLWAFAAWQKQKKKIDDSPCLFDINHFSLHPHIALTPDLPKENQVEMLRREFSVLGFLCACHPIILFKNIIQQYNTVKAKHLPKFINKKVTFAGWLITGKVVKTKQGDPMKFLTFEDETGIVETIFFPKPYALFCHMLDYGKPYLIYGKLESNWGAITLTVERTRPISFLKEKI